MPTTGAAAAAAENAAYKQVFDYLSAPFMPLTAEPTIVFGRQDPLVAQAFGNLIIPGLVEIGVITGGIGKDSGTLLEQGYSSEADYLLAILIQDAVERDYDLPKIILDEKASNGGENARNSTDILLAHGPVIVSATTNTHATSSLRLAETFQFEAEKKIGGQPIVHRNPSAYIFNPKNPGDRDEAANELLRLADWPAKGHLGQRRSDIPEDLVEFVRARHGDAPKPVAPWQAAILRHLGPRTQQRVIKLAAKRGRK